MHDFALPAGYEQSAKRCFLPLADWLNEKLLAARHAPLVLGINGAQGTGKSTLAELLKRQLSDDHGRRAEVLSIDDLYLTKAEREQLAKDVHPLLGTRGVPGTHDIRLGLSLLQQLRTLEAGQSVDLPRFDKATDERCDKREWASVSPPVDVLILEGWCVGSVAVPDEELLEPANELEAEKDTDGLWRRYVNEQLKTNYAAFFAHLDGLVFLQAPGFDAIFRWRLEQEQKLRQRSGSRQSGVMNEQEIRSFIQHYERITRHNLKHLPAIADARIELNEEHEAVSLTFDRTG